MGVISTGNKNEVVDPLVENWRAVLVWPVIFCLLRIVLYLTTYRIESPLYYLEKLGETVESEEKVTSVLKRIYHEDDYKYVYEHLLKEYNAVKDAGKPSFTSIFTKKYRKQALAGALLQIMQQLSGITFFYFYATKIFDSIGVNGTTANLVMTVSCFVGGILCMYTINKFGRKKNIMIGCFCQAVSFWGLFIMNVTGNWTMLYPTCCLYMVAYSIGLGGSSYAWCSEILPPIGVGFTILVQNSLVAVIGKFTPDWASGWPGVQGLMLIFALCCTFGLFVLDWAVIETKGKKGDEVMEEYANLKYKCCNYK